MATSQKTGDLELGQKIAQRRDELGMTRKQLAEATELSYAYISQIETGYRLPSAKHHVILARVLGVSLDELFGAEEAPPVPVRSQVFAHKAAVQAPLTDIAEPRSRRRPSIDEVIEQAAQEIESLPSSVRLEALSRLQLRIMQSVAEDQARQRR
jgi:transcriptional regulator with XRE-family HTH domain